MTGLVLAVLLLTPAAPAPVPRTPEGPAGLYVRDNGDGTSNTVYLGRDGRYECVWHGVAYHGEWSWDDRGGNVMVDETREPDAKWRSRYHFGTTTTGRRLTLKGYTRRH